MFFFFPFVTLHVLCITIKVWQYMFYVQPNYYSPQLIPVALLPFTSTQTSLSLPHGSTVYSTESPIWQRRRNSFLPLDVFTRCSSLPHFIPVRQRRDRTLEAILTRLNAQKQSPVGWELRARKTFNCTPIVGLLNCLTQLEEDISELHNMLHQSKELFEKLLERKAAKSLVEDAKV